jgi:hypothetical protein
MMKIQSTNYQSMRRGNTFFRIILSSWMFEILDYKWKTDPVTGQERWLEVIRAMGPLTQEEMDICGDS